MSFDERTEPTGPVSNDAGLDDDKSVAYKAAWDAGFRAGQNVFVIPEMFGCCMHCGKRAEVTTGPVNDTVCIGVTPRCICDKGFNIWPANGVSARASGDATGLGNARVMASSAGTPPETADDANYVHVGDLVAAYVYPAFYGTVAWRQTVIDAALRLPQEPLAIIRKSLFDERIVKTTVSMRDAEGLLDLTQDIAVEINANVGWMGETGSAIELARNIVRKVTRACRDAGVSGGVPASGATPDTQPDATPTPTRDALDEILELIEADWPGKSRTGRRILAMRLRKIRGLASRETAGPTDEDDLETLIWAIGDEIHGSHYWRGTPVEARICARNVVRKVRRASRAASRSGGGDTALLDSVAGATLPNGEPSELTWRQLIALNTKPVLPSPASDTRGDGAPDGAGTTRETAAERLVHLATLQPDWDSYGAVAPTPRAIDVARRMLAACHGVFPFPTSGGGVLLEWLFDDTLTLGIEISAEGTPEFSATIDGKDYDSDFAERSEATPNTPEPAASSPVGDGLVLDNVRALALRLVEATGGDPDAARSAVSYAWHDANRAPVGDQTATRWEDTHCKCGHPHLYHNSRGCAGTCDEATSACPCVHYERRAAVGDQETPR